ncbi:MAG: transposase [Spirochaetaceae bacterium]|jgi:transposase/IS5 family transposase|nr:transposase [Spirochaetaceae bacterium]
MKSITEILGGSQILLDISYDIQDVFEDYLTDTHRLYLAMLRIIESALPLLEENRSSTGRKPYALNSFIRAFLAKSFFKLTTNKDLILQLKSDSSLRKICGFSVVPSEATFSRRFEIISNCHLMEQVINRNAEEYLRNHIIGHISRDSMSITAREKPINRKKDVKAPDKAKRKRGRPKKGEVRPPKEDSRLTRQLSQKPGKSIKELDRNCAWGGKKNSKGKTHYWPGYKLHLDVNEFGLPVTAVVTGANVHDSQVAIPMEKMTERKVTHLYSLMDAAYDAPQIRFYIQSKGRVDLIDFNKRKTKELRIMSDHEKQRYKIRSTVERANSHLRDWFIPDKIYVKGYKKVNCTLMTAVVCLSAVKILQYFHYPATENAA